MLIRIALGTVVVGALGCAQIAGVDAWHAADSGAGTGGAGTGGAGAVDDYAALVLGDGPEAYWRFDEPAGAATASDSSGHGIDGIYVAGVTLEAAGAIEGNTAVELDGNGGHVDFGDVLDFDATRPFTFETWLSLTAKPDDLYRMLFIKQIEEPRSGHFIFLRGATDEDSGIIYERYEDGAFLCGAKRSALPSVDTFVHIAVAFDGARAILYVDGVPHFGCEGRFSISATPNASFKIGTPGSGLAAVVDEAAVFDHALSADQVKARLTAAGR
jgi:hypothetical protein